MHVTGPPPELDDKIDSTKAWCDWRDREFVARASMLLQQGAQLKARDAEIAALRLTIDQMLTVSSGLKPLPPKEPGPALRQLSPEEIKALLTKEKEHAKEVRKVEEIPKDLRTSELLRGAVREHFERHPEPPDESPPATPPPPVG